MANISLARSQYLTPPIMFCDNMSSLFMTINPVLHSRSKHIELYYHFVREQVALGRLVTKYVPTVYQIIDVFTKPLSKASLIFFKTILPQVLIKFAGGY